MTSRREFVRGSLVLSTLGAFSFNRAHAHGALLSAAVTAAPIIAIADRSVTAGAEFTVEAARHGIGIRGFEHDVGGLWLHEIEPAIRARGAALVGLTGAGVLFCLETLARAHDCGVVFRAERPAGGGESWERVAARHALAAAAAAEARGGTVLEPFEHVVRPAAADPPLFAWAIARDGRRDSPATAALPPSMAVARRSAITTTTTR